jgi:hypothetical protein
MTVGKAVDLIYSITRETGRKPTRLDLSLEDILELQRDMDASLNMYAAPYPPTPAECASLRPTNWYGSLMGVDIYSKSDDDL